MRPAFTIVLLLLLGLFISCGGEIDTPPERPPVPDPNVVRMNGGCTDERFLDAEWTAYQKLLRAREEAARILKNEIDRLEMMYNSDKAQRNADYVSTLNQCAANTVCSEAAKAEYDKWIGRAQIYHDDGIYVAQGNEQAAKETAQQEYEAAVKEAREKYCRRGYRAAGNDGGVVYSGIVCDLEKPFKITGTQPDFTYTYHFSPSSKTGGTGNWSAPFDGGSASGTGPYTVNGAETDKPRIVWRVTVTVVAPYARHSRPDVMYDIDLVPLDTDECGGG